MHLIGVRLRNFMRFRGEQEIALGPGAWAIIARDQDDPERSNYLGKSSLIGALLWCLRGCQVREEFRTLDDLISYGEDEMSVEQEFSNGLFVSRVKKRGKSSDLYVAIDGREGRGEKAQLLLDEVLGISHKDMLSTCWAEQREIGSFVRLKSTPLTEKVENWLGIENLVQAGELANKRFSIAVDQLDQARKQLVQLEKEVGTLQDEADLEQAIYCTELEIEEGDRKVKGAKEKLKLYSKRKRCREIVDEHDRLLEELLDLEKSLKNVDRTDLLQWVQKEREFSIKYSELQTKRASLNVLRKGEFDGLCPVSDGFQCPAKKEILVRKKEHQEQYDSVTEEATKVRNQRDELQEKIEVAREAEVLQTRIKGKIEVLEKRIEELEDQIMAYQNEEIEPLGDEEEEPEIPDPPDKTSLNELRNKLSKMQIAKKALPKAQEELSNLEHQLAVLRAVNSVLGPEGARRRVIERTVNHIWNDATERLNRAGVDLKLVPTWGRETGKPAEHCPECGTSFGSSAKVKQCLKCGAPRGLKVRHEFRTVFERSGGSEDLAGFALRIAGFEWMKAKEGFDWGIGVFDEPGTALDAYHRKVLGSHLLRLLGASFEQVFLVSHDRGFLSAVTNKIVITSDGQWSKVEVS